LLAASGGKVARMILAYHAIFTAYGFWPPNDPRGSWSEFVAAWDLVLAAGKATKTDDPRSLARQPHDRSKRLAAKEAMKYPPVNFTGRQALAISQGFQLAMREAGYVLYACAILPDHVHAVLARHERHIKRIVGHLKGKATMRMAALGVHPLTECVKSDGTIPTPWVEGCWKVFLDRPEDVVRAIDYANGNPERAGLPRQHWSFVSPFTW
jgi:REP element-mobilizing transposase RayT